MARSGVLLDHLWDVTGRLWGGFRRSEAASGAETRKIRNSLFYIDNSMVYEVPRALKLEVFAPGSHVLSMLEHKRASGEHAGC